MPADDAEVDDLVTALLTASRVLVGVSARSLADLDESVTVTQFRVLVVLRGHGETRLNRLAERLGVTPSTALRTVDRLIVRTIVQTMPRAEAAQLVQALTAFAVAAEEPAAALDAATVWGW